MILLLWLALQTPVRTYWKVSIPAMAAGLNAHTHVQVTGRVDYARQEKDGDIHIRLSKGGKFIVAECIPKLPCKLPNVGDLVTVFGISRFDGEHKWWEVHPVEEIH